MANEVILNASDITVPRRPHEFIEWVERKAKSLGASHEAKTYARSGAPLSNKFHDEIYLSLSSQDTNSSGIPML